MFNRWNAHRLADRARDLFEDTRDVARERASDANSFIHARPIAAALLGVGAGLALGVLYKSVRRSEPATAPERHRPRATRRTRRTARS